MATPEEPGGAERLDAAQARSRALSLIDSESQALDEQHCYETEHCWVFVYNSKRFVETRDPDEVLFGNAPIIISKVDGSLVPTGTNQPVERYVARYERSLNKPWWRFWRRR